MQLFSLLKSPNADKRVQISLGKPYHRVDGSSHVEVLEKCLPALSLSFSSPFLPTLSLSLCLSFLPPSRAFYLPRCCSSSFRAWKSERVVARYPINSLGRVGEKYDNLRIRDLGLARGLYQSSLVLPFPPPAARLSLLFPSSAPWLADLFPLLAAR